MSNDKIKQLEAELAEAKKQEAQQQWEAHMTEAKEYLSSLVGKTFLRFSSNGQMMMFKVTGFKETHCADREGAYGQWGPARWFELKVSQSISFRHGNFRPELRYANCVFNKITGKKKDPVYLS